MIDETDLETCRELWMKDVDRHAAERSQLANRIAELEAKVEENEKLAIAAGEDVERMLEQRDARAARCAVLTEVLEKISEAMTYRWPGTGDNHTASLFCEALYTKDIARQALSSPDHRVNALLGIAGQAKIVCESSGESRDFAISAMAILVSQYSGPLAYEHLLPLDRGTDG